MTIKILFKKLSKQQSNMETMSFEFQRQKNMSKMTAIKIMPKKEYSIKERFRRFMGLKCNRKTSLEKLNHKVNKNSFNY